MHTGKMALCTLRCEVRLSTPSISHIQVSPTTRLLGPLTSSLPTSQGGVALFWSSSIVKVPPWVRTSHFFFSFFVARQPWKFCDRSSEKEEEGEEAKRKGLKSDQKKKAVGLLRTRRSVVGLHCICPCRPKPTHSVRFDRQPTN